MMRKTQFIFLLFFYLCSYSQSELQQKNNDALELLHQAKFKDAQSLLNEVLNKSKNDSEEYANAKYILGEEKMMLGNYKEALEDFNTSKEINQQAGRTAALAKNLNDIAITYWKLGNKESAIENLKFALSILEKTSLKKELADTYNNLGLIMSEDYPEKSLVYYHKALSFYESEFGTKNPNYLITKNNIGIGLRNTNKSWEAIETFKIIQNEWIEMYGKNNPKIAFTEANIGQALFKEKEYKLAKESFQKAIRIYTSNYGNQHPELANTYLLLANNYLSQKKYNKAISTIDSALISNKNIETTQPIDQQLFITTLQEKAEIYIHRYKFKSLSPKDLKYALTTLESCTQYIENQRRILLTKKDKIILGNLASQVYDMAIECILILKTEFLSNKDHYNQQLFSYIEKSKAAVLLESMQDAQAKQFGNVPENLLNEEKILIASISTFENQLALSNTGKETRENLNTTRIEYRKLISKLETDYPDYYDLKYNIDPIKLSDIQKKLNPNETMINYFISERNQKLIVFIISKSKTQTKILDHTKEFKKWLLGFQNSVQFSNLSIFTLTSSKLYALLGLDKISETELIIIPDSYLNTIPFESLIIKKPKADTAFSNLDYLIKSKTINYHFSASLWSKTEIKTKKPSLTYFAPVYFKESFGFSDLPGSLNETLKLDSLFKNSDLVTSGFIKEKATETSVQQAKNGSILHLPTHGAVNTKSPELSCVYLYKDNQNDGILYSGEIYNSQLNYNLITLSACETGRGKITKGEGVIGLSRALLYAGADNLIVSYWKVNDSSTSILMVDFYTSYLKGKDYKTALKNSKTKMINSEKYSSPYYWAPFVLIGH